MNWKKQQRILLLIHLLDMLIFYLRFIKEVCGGNDQYVIWLWVSLTDMNSKSFDDILIKTLQKVVQIAGHLL